MSHHHCSEDSCCGHEKNSCHEQSCCCQKNCSCPCHSHEDDCKKNHADKLLCLADQAWMEVLKDKIKQEILKNSGEHLDGLAKLVASYNSKRWRDKIEAKKGCCDFDEQLRNLMCGGKGGSCSK